jgi:hypothetical protein
MWKGVSLGRRGSLVRGGSGNLAWDRRGSFASGREGVWFGVGEVQVESWKDYGSRWEREFSMWLKMVWIFGL